MKEHVKVEREHSFVLFDSDREAIETILIAGAPVWIFITGFILYSIWSFFSWLLA